MSNITETKNDELISKMSYRHLKKIVDVSFSDGFID